jgi:hypothetical protein
VSAGPPNDSPRHSDAEIRAEARAFDHVAPEAAYRGNASVDLFVAAFVAGVRFAEQRRGSAS